MQACLRGYLRDCLTAKHLRNALYPYSSVLPKLAKRLQNGVKTFLRRAQSQRRTIAAWQHNVNFNLTTTVCAHVRRMATPCMRCALLLKLVCQLGGVVRRRALGKPLVLIAKEGLRSETYYHCFVSIIALYTWLVYISQLRLILRSKNEGKTSQNIVMSIYSIDKWSPSRHRTLEDWRLSGSGTLQ